MSKSVFLKIVPFPWAELFKNEELAEARTKTKWYCGKYGYSVWQYFVEVKDGMMQEASDYLAKHASTEK